MTTEYIVLCAQVVGNPSDGFSIHHNFDGERFRTRKSAIRHGFAVRGSDDFNVGVVEGGKLVSLDWMEETVDSDPAELCEIAEQIGIGCQETGR